MAHSMEEDYYDFFIMQSRYLDGDSMAPTISRRSNLSFQPIMMHRSSVTHCRCMGVYIFCSFWHSASWENNTPNSTTFEAGYPKWKANSHRLKTSALYHGLGNSFEWRTMISWETLAWTVSASYDVFNWEPSSASLGCWILYGWFQCFWRQKTHPQLSIWPTYLLLCRFRTCPLVLLALWVL
jgi:hypothetical protein